MEFWRYKEDAEMDLKRIVQLVDLIRNAGLENDLLSAAEKENIVVYVPGKAINFVKQFVLESGVRKENSDMHVMMDCATTGHRPRSELKDQ